MSGTNLVDIFREGNIVIPIFFMRKYKDLKLNLNEFLFLMYLYTNRSDLIFDPEKMSNDLGMDITEVMEIVSNLTEKNFISVITKKNDKGYMEDIISIEGFYNKIKLLVVNDYSSKKSDEINNSTIYEYIEKEFSRTLSSIEYEIIRAWLENNIDEDLIKEAVKEAVFNGVSNLKYIDKILYEWGKIGVKTVEDVEKNRKKRQTRKDNANIKDSLDMDLMDWNWFDDDE